MNLTATLALATVLQWAAGTNVGEFFFNFKSFKEKEASIAEKGSQKSSSRCFLPGKVWLFSTHGST
jgi:hypothetical protein